MRDTPTPRPRRAALRLRDGLDASDFKRFPASEFGGQEGNKRDVERYIRIAEAYAKQGARMDDPEKATAGGMVNRKRSGSNDVGWGILPGNYSRFLTQVDPGSGDRGLWNIDESIYGRFARSFDHQSGKKQLRFKLHQAFFAEPEKNHSVDLRITWLDRGTGVWSLAYAGADGKEKSSLVTNTGTGTGTWRTQRMHLQQARFNGLLHDADLLLRYESGEDTIFHMLEIERPSAP